MASQRLDEVEISKDFDLNAAISSLRFYWGLARHKQGGKIVMEIWESTDVKSTKDADVVLVADERR